MTETKIFKASCYGSHEVEWLLNITDEETWPFEDAFYFYVKDDDYDFHLWQQNNEKKWRCDANTDWIGRLRVHLACHLEKHFFRRNGASFSKCVERLKKFCRNAVELLKPATKAEIAEALATTADVLDISVPEKQAAFIIERIHETELPSFAVWSMCRDIARKEKGRHLKPSIFEPYLESAYLREDEFKSPLWNYSHLYDHFDEALAYCLEKEPSLNFDAKQGEVVSNEAKLTFDADLNSGKAGG